MSARQTVHGGVARVLCSCLAPFLLAGCAAAPAPCRSPVHCGAGHECLAHRCLPLGADPIAGGRRRVVLEPVGVAVVSSRAPGNLPPTVTFGGAEAETLVLGFPHTWQTLNVTAAFLLLTPLKGAEPTRGDVPVEVAAAVSGWAPGSIPEAPSGQGPVRRAFARTSPPALLRIDVTDLVRESAGGAASSLDLLIHAAATTDRGATYSTGVYGGAPRLELYGNPARRQRR